jgi:hypothetical protein
LSSIALAVGACATSSTLSLLWLIIEPRPTAAHISGVRWPLAGAGDQLGHRLGVAEQAVLPLLPELHERVVHAAHEHPGRAVVELLGGVEVVGDERALPLVLDEADAVLAVALGEDAAQVGLPGSTTQKPSTVLSVPGMARAASS